MRISKRTFCIGFALIILTTFSSPLIAQQDCSSDPYFSKLDFWVGEWEVYDSQEQKIGTNIITKTMKDCAIEEYWTDAQGGKGKSLFYVEQNDSTWHQVWVTENAKLVGGQKHKVLVEELDDGGVRFQGHYFYKGIRVEDRTTLTPNADGTVKQLIERSTDGGKTWNTGFLGIYKPATSAEISNY